MKWIEDKRETCICCIHQKYCWTVFCSVHGIAPLTEVSVFDQEIFQKDAKRLISGEKYDDYKDLPLWANLERLKERREKLCRTFAIKCLKSENPRINNIFKNCFKKLSVYHD